MNNPKTNRKGKKEGNMVLEVPQKVIHRNTTQSSNSASRNIPENWRYVHIEKRVALLIWNTQIIVTNQIYTVIDEQSNKMWYIHTTHWEQKRSQALTHTAWWMQSESKLRGKSSHKAPLILWFHLCEMSGTEKLRVKEWLPTVDGLREIGRWELRFFWAIMILF